MPNILEASAPMISIVVLAWNGERFLETCLAAIVAQDYASTEVIVVDNASTDKSVDLVRSQFPAIKLITNATNLGYSAGNNVGIRASKGDIVVLLNQDTQVQPGWLAAIAESFEAPATGIVGCKALYPDGRTLQHAGGRVRAGDAFTHHIGQGEIDQGQYDEPGEDLDFVTGASLAIHRRVLDRIGLLDEGFYPAFFEDVDYCQRARRAGFRILFQPQAALIHHETTSLPQESFRFVGAWQRNRLRYILRHQGVAEINSDFAAAEEAAIEQGTWLDDILARARAYWDNLVELPFIVSQRAADDTLGPPLSAEQALALTTTLHDLRLQARQRVNELVIAAAHQPPDEPQTPPPSAPHQSPSPARGPMPPLAVSAQALRTMNDELEPLRRLPEHRFTSDLPGLGPLVARFRELWLSVAARWYVFPLIEQQSKLNAGTARMIDQVASELENTCQELETMRDELGLVSQELDATQRATAALRQDLAGLRREVQALRGTVDRQHWLSANDDTVMAAAIQRLSAHLEALYPDGEPSPRPSHSPSLDSLPGENE